MTDGLCPHCQKPYGKMDCVNINPVAELLKTKAKENMEERRARNREGELTGQPWSTRYLLIAIKWNMSSRTSVSFDTKFVQTCSNFKIK